MTRKDKEGIVHQMQCLLSPQALVDIAFDSKRKVAYAAVAYDPNGGEAWVPEGFVYAIVAPIYDADKSGDWYRDWGYRLTVNTDNMPAETQGIVEWWDGDCTYCPIRLLNKLSPVNFPSEEENRRAQEWRDKCRRNANRKRAK